MYKIVTQIADYIPKFVDHYYKVKNDPINSNIKYIYDYIIIINSFIE
jgi:hypothetical protein